MFIPAAGYVAVESLGATRQTQADACRMKYTTGRTPRKLNLFLYLVARTLACGVAKGRANLIKIWNLRPSSVTQTGLSAPPFFKRRLPQTREVVQFWRFWALRMIYTNI
jgi:hypothetical protein